MSRHERHGFEAFPSLVQIKNHTAHSQAVLRERVHNRQVGGVDYSIGANFERLGLPM